MNTPMQTVAPSLRDMEAFGISLVIPTYRRGDILIRTLDWLGQLDPPPMEILIVDQTEEYPSEVDQELTRRETQGDFRRIRFSPPSIPQAMNTGLREAKGAVVLFVDDDVVPAPDLVAAHAARHGGAYAAVCGQVLQPGEIPDPEANRGPRGEGFRADLDFRFCGTQEAEVTNVISCNLSVDRAAALAIGGFDEQFMGSAYRYETDFARRLVAAGHRIRFAPEASIRHLRLSTGGTRSHGDHLARPSPLHSVGDYYFALRHAHGAERAAYLAQRLFRETANRYCMRHPWKLPRKLASERKALAWARQLNRAGPRLISAEGLRPEPPRTPKAFYEAQYRDGRYAFYAAPEAHPFHGELRSLLAQHGPVNGKWLEVGCGRGTLQDAVEDYTGVDIAETVAPFLHKPFRCSPAEKLPFEDDCFDGAWSYAVLEHVKNPGRALTEMRRVLKSGGILLLSPAWQCRPWAGKNYARKPYRELSAFDRVRKSLIPLRDSVVFRAISVVPGRLFRWTGYLLHAGPTRFRTRRLPEPDGVEYRGVDSDARHHMDPFEAILWFRSRGDRVRSHPGWLRALTVRTGTVVAEMRKP